MAEAGSSSSVGGGQCGGPRGLQKKLPEIVREAIVEFPAGAAVATRPREPHWQPRSRHARRSGRLSERRARATCPPARNREFSHPLRLAQCSIYDVKSVQDVWAALAPRSDGSHTAERIAGSCTSSVVWRHGTGVDAKSTVRGPEETCPENRIVAETRIGGERPGKRGRGAQGKELVVIAVEDKDEALGRIPMYDDFTFRFNRRTSRSRVKVFYRVVQQPVAIQPVTEKGGSGGRTGQRSTRCCRYESEVDRPVFFPVSAFLRSRQRGVAFVRATTAPASVGGGVRRRCGDVQKGA